MRLTKSCFIFLSFILANQFVFADSSTLLNQAGSDIDLNQKIVTQKTLNLDDPFLIQLYGSWKAAGALSMSSNQWIEVVLNKDFSTALNSMSNLKEDKKNLQLNKMLEASELYLLFKTNHYQTFINRFIEVSSKSSFLQTELGVALDQIAGSNFTKILIDNGVYFTDEQLKNLKSLENYNSKINFSLQAFKALRTGENALVWIGKLEENDPLRLPLANTALLHYAKDGKLGASGKIIKSVIEPILLKSNNDEEISLYFMTLARLLYQAGALSESQKYYALIPETSKYFLKARTESLWAHIKAKDYSKTKGELGSLELKVFNNQFYPEAYLVSSMANVLLCQFSESRAAINRFVESNKYWAKEIEKNIGNEDAPILDQTFFLSNLEKSKVSLTNEIDLIKKSNSESIYLSNLNEKLKMIDNARKAEIQNQWKNRRTLLETALYKMKFVRIELISRMRQFEMNQPIANGDEVSVQLAANAKKDQLKFKNDGVLFGDELFHMSAKVKNKCILPNQTNPAVK